MDEEAIKEQVKQGVIYAMRLLMIAKRSEQDLRQRLSDKGYTDQSIEVIITDLKQKHYVDDERLATNYVTLAAPSKHVGRRRIALDLKRKGVSKEIVSDALKLLNAEEECRIAERAARLRYEKLSKLDRYTRRKRVYDFLIRRGFDYEMCRSILEQLEKNENS